jgi:hypothetical protein
MEHDHAECGGWTELMGCVRAGHSIKRRVWSENAVETDTVCYICVAIPCANIDRVVEERVRKEVGV